MLALFWVYATKRHYKHYLSSSSPFLIWIWCAIRNWCWKCRVSQVSHDLPRTYSLQPSGTEFPSLANEISTELSLQGLGFDLGMKMNWSAPVLIAEIRWFWWGASGRSLQRVATPWGQMTAFFVWDLLRYLQGFDRRPFMITVIQTVSSRRFQTAAREPRGGWRLFLSSGDGFILGKLLWNLFGLSLLEIALF